MVTTPRFPGEWWWLWMINGYFNNSRDDSACWRWLPSPSVFCLREPKSPLPRPKFLLAGSACFFCFFEREPESPPPSGRQRFPAPSVFSSSSVCLVCFVLRSEVTTTPAKIRKARLLVMAAATCAFCVFMCWVTRNQQKNSTRG